MGSAVPGICVFLSSVAIVLTLAALGTPEWMKACMDMSHVIKASGAASQLPPGFSLSGMSACMSIGVMEAGMNVANLVNMKVALSFSSKETALHVTAGLLVIACILLIAGLVCVSRGMCARSYSKSLSMQRTRTGSALNLSAGGLIMVAMIVYSATQAHNLHKPMNFVVTWSLGVAGGMQGGSGGLQSIFQNMGGNLGGNMGNIPNYPSAGDSGLPSNTNMGDINIPNLPNANDLNLPSDTNGFNFPTQWPLGPNRKKRQIPGLSGADASMAAQMFQGMDPVFGFSYYLGWMSALVAIIAGVLGMLMVCRRRSGEDFDRVPLA